jgi:putative ubiquitin-RnfH superfamily antitoxin RatB of RatAB toxin-antitoxin module
VISVEIVHARAQCHVAKSLQLPSGSLVADALTKAAEDADFAGIDLENSPVGIFGRLARKDQPLKDGDRIEIYRPLSEEPKLARRRRAADGSGRAVSSKSGRS